MPIRLKRDDRNQWTANDVDPKYEPDHYSPGQLNTASRCPRQYYFRYRCGLKIPPNGSMVLGSGVHEAIEASLIHKIRKGKLLLPSDAEDIAFEETKKRLKKEPVDLKDEKPAVLLDDATVLARRWTVKVGPKRKPLTKGQRAKIGKALPKPGESDAQDDRKLKEFTGVEAFIKLDLPRVDQPVVGWIDFLESAGRGGVNIRDTKTSGKKKNEGEARGPQLISYAIMMKLLKIPVNSVGLDVLVRPKPRTPDGTDQIIQVPAPTAPVMKSVVQGFQWLTMMNKAGNFPPCYGTHCGWCGYRELCDSVGTTFVV